jgi:flavin reductase (NADH)/flavin reductase
MAQMTIDLDTFRFGMRRLASGVCIITTTTDDQERWGATATAVCSVCADPPTLLCCLNRRSSTHDAIRRSGRLAVNVLSFEDRSLADRFASPMPPKDKFMIGHWLIGEMGSPILETALVSFDCRLVNAVDRGTHGIFFGEVAAVRRLEDEARPLLYASGAYGGFAASEERASA